MERKQNENGGGKEGGRDMIDECKTTRPHG
jgi:hypothetical protein